jgi:hypothetical protein
MNINENPPTPKKELPAHYGAGMLIDLSTPETTLALSSAQRYSKRGTVQARMAVEREEVVTTLANGLEETRNVAAPGDWVVTNPTGEVYVLSDETFNKRYYEAGDKYYARGMCRAIVNPYPHPIEILAPWGEKQFGDEDCIIAVVYDPETPEEVGPDRYLIGRKEFVATYRP